MSIKEAIRRVIPNRILYRVRSAVRRSEAYNLEIPERAAGPRIFFADAPDYGNLGDLAIGEAIRLFAGDYFPEYSFVSIPESRLPDSIGILKSVISPGDMIWMTGGGNMGNLYPMYEENRRTVVRTFKDNRVVIFPQTVHYTDDPAGCISFKIAARVYDSHPDLIICVREKKSFGLMKKAIKHASVELVPDMALYFKAHADRTKDLSFTPRNMKRHGYGVCLRDDTEAALEPEDRAMVIDGIITRGHEPVSITTVPGDIEEPVIDAGEYVRDIINKIGSLEHLTTDRLHPMIFAALTDTPFSVYDSRTPKIAGVREWLDDEGKIPAKLDESWDRLGDLIRKA